MAADGSLVFETELDNEGFKSGAADVQKRVESLCSSVDRFGKRIQQAGGEFASGLGDAFTRSFPKSIEGAAEKLKLIGQAKIPTDEFRRMSAEADKVAQKLETLLNRQEKLSALGVPDTSKQWQALQFDIQKTSEEYERYEAALSRMKQEGTAFTTASDTAEYQQLSGALEQLRGSMTPAAIAASALRSAVLSLGDRLRIAGAAALSAGKRLAALPFKAVAAGAKKAVSDLKRFSSQTRSTKSLTDSLVRSLTSLKTILISRIKRMFISGIFKNVQTALKALEQYSVQFGATMKQLRGSATQAGGNVAVLLSNIINTFSPFVNALVSMLSRAMTYLNSFFALLGGKQTVTVAKAAQNTESLAESTKKAAQAQKKYNAELYSFDELNRQSNNNTSDTGVDAETPATASGLTFEEVPIDLPKGVTDWIERLKDAWRKGDWYGLGQVAADGLNAGMKVVDDWINNTLRPLGVLWAGRIASILNGLVDKTNWPLMGKTVADALNAVADTANTFLEEFRAKNLGKGIGLAIKGWFDNIEWPLIGKAFANGWNFLLRTVEGIVTVPGIWESIGESIGKFVKSWFSTIDLNSAATSLIAMINGVSVAIRSFLEQNPFAGVAEKIYSAVNRLIHEVNWAELGKTLGDLFIAVFGVLLDALNNVDWFAIGQAVGQFLGGIDWPGVFSTVAAIVWSALKAAVEMLGGFLKEQGLNVLLVAIGALVAAIAKHLAVTLLPVLGKVLLAKVAELIAGVVAAIAGSPVLIIAAIAAVIAALVVWMKNGGAEVVAGFISGMGEKLKALGSWLKEHLVEPVKTAFNSAKTSAVKTATQMKTSLASTWNGIKTTVTTAFGNLKTTVEKNASALKTNLTNTWNGIKTNASNAWNNLSQTASTSFSKVTSGISTAWTKLKTALGNIKWSGIGEMMVAGIWNGISGKWSGLVNYVTGQINSFIQKVKNTLGIHSPSKVFAGIGENLDAGLEQGMENGKRGLLTTASNIASAVTEGMTPDTPNVEMTADGIVSSMQAITSGLSDIAVTFRAIADALTTAGGFTMPQIAEGTVVPYRTRVDSEAPQGDSDGVTTGYLLGILSELQALSRIIRNSSDQQQDIHISVSGLELFNVIVEENNRAFRRMGHSPLRI